MKKKFTLAEVFKLYRSSQCRAAFTLAEVLITLGIIGVVVAITLPTLTTKIKHKELETKFKKSYSIISQVTIDLPIELGTCPSEQYSNITQSIYAKLNKIQSGYSTDTTFEYSFKTYNLQNTTSKIHPNCLGGGHLGKIIVTADGAVISSCVNDTMGTYVSIDTNGFKNGPNAYGHDLFFFYINKQNCTLTPVTRQWRDCTDDDTSCPNGRFKWTEGVCSKSSTSGENGFACGLYAIQNICPDNKSKSYFDCLP